jgi:cytochrome b5
MADDAGIRKRAAAPKGKTFTAAEIAKHNTEEDCWLQINGKVYNVTKYLDEHPGGPEIMLDNSGREAGEEFDDIGHSDDAMEQMNEYLIGTVEGYDASKYESASGSGSGSGGGGAGLALVLIPLVLAALYYVFVVMPQEEVA